MTGTASNLVVTADDFGLARAVNEAVEIAHREGILSAASLMVGGAAASDAVARARRLRRLRVGLHLVLLDGDPMLPLARIPDLLGDDGRLRTDMVALSFALATRSRLRSQLAAEVEAQFEAFRATGLALDHVNAHKHFHLHPIVARIVLDVGRRFGVRALRVPHEPAATLRRAGASGAAGQVERVMARWLRRRARSAGLVTPDAVLGLSWSGALTVERLAALLRARPRGFVELYTHPATSDTFEGAAPGYRYAEELAALCHPICREILASASPPCGYADVNDLELDRRLATALHMRPT